MNEFPELRSALMAAADRQRHLAASEGKAAKAHGRWWPRQLRVLVIAIVALLVAAAVALAAVGVFSVGRPVTPVLAPTPRAGDGAAIPSTIRLIDTHTQDPAGGPAWGLRLVRTTRKEVCVIPGRVQGQVIGVLGRDGAFGDDGQLHPFAHDYLAPLGCTVPDARGHAFLSIGQVGLPASALGPGKVSSAGGCRVDNPPPANHALLCPTGALRNVYYGLLGPDAASVTYRTASGAVKTQRTVGPDGAYLIVLPYTHGPQGTATIGTGLSGPPFVAVHYRDGHTCTAVSATTACQPVGHQAPSTSHLTDAQVRAPVSVRVARARSYCSSKHSGTVVACNGPVPRGFSRIHGTPFVLVNISFTPRVPVTSSHSYYQLDSTYTKSRGCTVGGTAAPTDNDIHAGQRIHMQDFVQPGCPGPIHYVVTYVPSSPPGAPNSLPGSPGIDSLVVGRVVVNPVAKQR